MTNINCLETYSCDKAHSISIFEEGEEHLFIDDNSKNNCIFETLPLRTPKRIVLECEKCPHLIALDEEVHNIQGGE